MILFFSCQYCDLRFYRLIGLQQHVQKHSNQSKLLHDTATLAAPKQQQRSHDKHEKIDVTDKAAKYNNLNKMQQMENVLQETADLINKVTDGNLIANMQQRENDLQEILDPKNADIQNVEEMSFLCPVCDQSFTNLEPYDEHALSHSYDSSLLSNRIDSFNGVLSQGMSFNSYQIF